MAYIKSALEIAMERSEGVKPDKKKIETRMFTEKGKIIASEYLKDPENSDNDIRKILKTFSGDNLKWVKEGIFSVFLANLVIPQTEVFQDKLAVIEKGFHSILKDKSKIGYIFKQIDQFFTQYLENMINLEENLIKQFEPRLKQKEQELSERMGSDFHLNPMQDPDFVKALQQNRTQLKNHFNSALLNVKNEISEMNG